MAVGMAGDRIAILVSRISSGATVATATAILTTLVGADVIAIEIGTTIVACVAIGRKIRRQEQEAGAGITDPAPVLCSGSVDS